jgi:hypothetical protein
MLAASSCPQVWAPRFNPEGRPSGFNQMGAAVIVCKQTTALCTTKLAGRITAARTGERQTGKDKRGKTNGQDGGDDRDRTGDPLLAKQVLSQLSYAPNLDTHLAKQDPPDPDPPNPSSPGLKHHRSTVIRDGQIALVGQGGFEPPTPRLSSVCSNQLSY